MICSRPRDSLDIADRDSTIFICVAGPAATANFWARAAAPPDGADAKRGARKLATSHRQLHFQADMPRGLHAQEHAFELQPKMVAHSGTIQYFRATQAYHEAPVDFISCRLRPDTLPRR